VKFNTPNHDNQGGLEVKKASARLEIAASDIAGCSAQSTILITAPSQFEKLVQTVLRRYNLLPSRD
jgi:hypothetical protein